MVARRVFLLHKTNTYTMAKKVDAKKNLHGKKEVPAVNKTKISFLTLLDRVRNKDLNRYSNVTVEINEVDLSWALSLHNGPFSILSGVEYETNQALHHNVICRLYHDPDPEDNGGLERNFEAEMRESVPSYFGAADKAVQEADSLGVDNYEEALALLDVIEAPFESSESEVRSYRLKYILMKIINRVNYLKASALSLYTKYPEIIKYYQDKEGNFRVF